MLCRTILLVLVVSPLVNSLMSLSDVGDVISFAHEVIIDILQAGKLIAPFLEGEGPEHIDLPLLKDKEKKLMARIAVINTRMERVDKMVQSVISASKLNLQQDLPSQIRLELRIDSLMRLVSMMNFADNNFKEYSQAGHLDNSTEPKLERHTLESFASHVVSHDPDSVQGIMDRLHGMISPDRNQGHAFLHPGILPLIARVLQEPRKGHLSDYNENALCCMINSRKFVNLR